MISFHHQPQHPQTASLASPGFLPHGSKLAALFANITTFSGRRGNQSCKRVSLSRFSLIREKNLSQELSKNTFTWVLLAELGHMASPGYKRVWESDHLACLFYMQDTCQPLLLQRWCAPPYCSKSKRNGYWRGANIPALVGIWHHHTHSAYVPRAHWTESMMTDKTIYCGIHKDLGQRPQLKPFNTVILYWILTEIFQNTLDTPASYKVL